MKRRPWAPHTQLPIRWSDPDLLGPSALARIAVNRFRDAAERRIDRMTEINERLTQQVERVEREQAERERLAREARRRLSR
jgi:hypothetical protein